MHRFLLILLLSFPIFGEEINDPFEDLNRDIFIFNEKLDEKLLKPAALTYRKVTPQFARTGVTNFFNNLETINLAIQDGHGFGQKKFLTRLYFKFRIHLVSLILWTPFKPVIYKFLT